ncbi:MAG TPA: hypothetical protein VFK05_05695 [Polyangiaceae bacterium]|nr:hypothetical protein [Polyangiaceae bacterium]
MLKRGGLEHGAGEEQGRRMDLKPMITRVALLFAATNYGCTACARSPHRYTQPAPSFASVITSSFLLENLKNMSGMSALAPVPSGASTSTGYTFAVPGSEKPGGEAYVVTIDYSARQPSTSSTDSSPGAAHPGAESCLRDLQQLPFSAGPDGSFRAVKFTTLDARYDVQVGVFEKLKDTTVDRPLELDRVAALIAEKYCAAYRNPQKPRGSKQ